MASDFNSPNLVKRIIDAKDSETYDQLYFVGTKNNYTKKTGRTNSSNVTALGNFWVNEEPVKSQFRDILDGGDSSLTSTQFEGPVIGGEFPTERGPLNSSST